MIAIDWGTSSLRAYLLSASGEVIEQRRAALGILSCEGRFEAVLTEAIAGWDDALIVLSGMIGSRQGWREVPYVPCPAGPADIAAGMVRIHAASLPGRDIRVIPGLLYQPSPDAADVMRGEETQTCGLLDELGAGRHTICLPGTHNKWVIVDQGRIAQFFTAMTGEVFQVLRQHSILGKLMQGEAEDVQAFSMGIARAAQPGGLLHHLFSARTLGLFGTLQADQLASYLSGVLIGHEVLELAPDSELVHLIGNEKLTELYTTALTTRGIATHRHGEALVARGIHLLAKAGGLVG